MLEKLGLLNFSFPHPHNSTSESTASLMRRKYGRLSGSQLKAIKRLYQQDLDIFYPEDDTYKKLMNGGGGGEEE